MRMEIDRVYDRLLPSCSSINQVNRLHIRLENLMTPTEATRVSAHIARTYAADPSSRIAALRSRLAQAVGRFPEPGEAPPLSDRERLVEAVEWGARITAQLGLASTPDPSPVTRRWRRGGATYYQASADPSSLLVLGFTGNMQRLMMPTPVFLQHLAPFGADLLLLAVEPGTAYVRGVRGASSDFPGTVEWLRDFVPRHGAARFVTVGTSAGAFPAVLAGLALQADSLLAVGAYTRQPAAYSRTGGDPALSEVVHEYVTAGPRPSRHLMYGSDSSLDAEFARNLAETLDGSALVPVEDADHNCLYPLAIRRQLEAVLASTLFQGVPVPGRTP